ncbi:UbiH/UbiF family hydroxylase [Pararhizobium sp.]|uniref:UbiH/UbiF family hydroxylase n=1 Tax=Pararhizobium sp. TaxID=1977563 RepID=UPI0027230B45|nr:UbiH/UbiF family hydroxylase [Pararhizobium sp.]MDO9418589.1 UbiH/UbiF family hydroxylase [Pararhizobium sp.]
MKNHDVAVIGAGLAGSIATLALAGLGYSVVRIAPATARPDGRTTALMDPSITILKDLGLWDGIQPHTAPLSVMQILDGTSRLIRAPAVSFRAAELGMAAFGYNIPNALFLEQIEATLRSRREISLVEANVTGFDLTEAHCEMMLDTGETIMAGIVVGADGRHSATREAAGIDSRTWSYPQTALVLTFAHSLPHRETSIEFHTESGPFTQVPLPGNRSSLVWVCKPEDAERLMAKPKDALSRDIEIRMQSVLGKIDIDSPVQSFPLSGMKAARCGKGRVVLISEAAHAFPPIGAQGLNLGLRDIASLMDLLGPKSESPIDSTIGDRFDRVRRTDIASRTVGVDLLNRSLLSDFLPVQVLRAAGLQALASGGPLRSFIMREGLAPGSALSGTLASIARGLREKIGRQRA